MGDSKKNIFLDFQKIEKLIQNLKNWKKNLFFVFNFFSDQKVNLGVISDFFFCFSFFFLIFRKFQDFLFFFKSLTWLAISSKRLSRVDATLIFPPREDSSTPPADSDGRKFFLSSTTFVVLPHSFWSPSTHSGRSCSTSRRSFSRQRSTTSFSSNCSSPCMMSPFRMAG